MKEVNRELRTYIEDRIIPMYDSFDKGHRRDHVAMVIEQALAFCTHYDVDPDMVYTAAAYHDTGLCEDRKNHHIVSAGIIRNDRNLRRFFSEEQIDIIADAAQDHRASLDYDPRTIYGRIIAEADRQIIPETVIRRTIQFGIKNYPELDREGHWRRTVEHLKEKYAAGGYLKLWIPESPNAARLEKLRGIIGDTAALRRIFERIFLEETGFKAESFPFSCLDGISVGNAQDNDAKTGVTVFYFKEPAKAAVSVLGGGPASRETALLDLDRNNVPLNALVFAGGSSFGLEASHGVMKCLEDNNIGFDTGCAKVPIVCQSDIYDLSYGKAGIRPDMDMGMEACLAAMRGSSPQSGNVGAGTGATVGKPKGVERGQKSGIGYAASGIGSLKVGVAAVVNAYGDIYFHGKKIAGMKNPARDGFCDVVESLFETQPENLFTGNTTIVAVFTNADFDAATLKKVANMASAGMARAIRPAFTMADGDTIYALSVGSDKTAADVNVVGSLAADLVEEAIRDAVESSAIPEEEYLANV